MHGGFWAELFSFSLANPPDAWPAELVARLMPDPETARKERIVQTAVAGAGFPTPFVRVSGGPDCGLGRAFMVMDRAAGRSALAGLDGRLTLAAVPRLLRQVPGSLAGPMALWRLLASSADFRWRRWLGFDLACACEYRIVERTRSGVREHPVAVLLPHPIQCLEARC